MSASFDISREASETSGRRNDNRSPPISPMNGSSMTPLVGESGQNAAAQSSTFFKTKFCPQMQQKGRCLKGPLCFFAHSHAELRRPPVRMN